MDEVIVFDKSLQQRLQEYVDILGTDHVPVSQIKQIWAIYLELAVDYGGWQAIWKICRSTCNTLKISAPTLALIYVEDVNPKEHAACVRILAVEDDIKVPERHIVPLMHLYPTKDQAKTVVLNMYSTANALDSLRFFYNNIIAPWDFDEDDTSDWVSKHLEARLRLYYDMKNGVMTNFLAEHIRGLFMEARRLQRKKEQIELEIDDEDLDQNLTTNERIENLSHLHIRMLQIKGEIEILENPLLRNIVIKEKEEKNDVKPTTWVITQTSSAVDYIEFLESIKIIYPNELLTFSYNLLNTLESLKPSDKVLLNKSKYHLETVGKIIWGGTIKGTYASNLTEISSESDDISLDLSGEVHIENLRINTYKSQCGILIRSGKVTLKNCVLVGKHQGIIVLHGSHLVLQNCEITGFSTALVGNSGSKVDIRETNIHHVDLGIRLYDGCLLNVAKTTLSNCQEYGFCLETSKADNTHQVGTFQILKELNHITTDEIQGINNRKGDVSINRTRKLLPLKDLFAAGSDGMDTDSDEDKENVNITVIQVKN